MSDVQVHPVKEVPARPRPASGQMTRTVRRPELRRIVPLADTTIYEMEQRGEFPRRFYLTPRCAAWDLGEVEAWLAERRTTSEVPTAGPDVRLRRSRPTRTTQG